MKKIVLIAVAVFAIGFSGRTQSIYVELGGPGLASFNFDTRFSQKEDGLGGRVGFGGFSVGDGNGDKVGVVFIPVGVNYLLGRDQKNYFEIGAGITPVIATAKSSTGDNGSFNSTFGHILFGYRMQPAAGGFTFRAFVSPVFGEGGFIPYYGGVSFGYKFNAKKDR